MNWQFYSDALLTNLFISLIIQFLACARYFFEKKAAISEVAWAFTFVAMSVATFSLSDAYYLRKIFFILLALLWSGRLTGYLFLRYMKSAEDSRYMALRERFGTILWLFLVQAILAPVLSWPLILIASNSSHTISALEWSGIVMIALAAALEAHVDWQLYRFRSLPSNEGKVCKQGFWAYSRHPNYFFEWIVWVGFFLFALDAPLGFSGIIAPIIMWYVLIELSGIPYAEKASLQDRGEEYIKYQQETGAFFPRLWKKKP